MRNRALFGLLLVLLGAAFLLNNIFNVFDGFGDWWPLLVILIGLVQIFKRSASIITGLIIMVFGFIFLASNLNWISKDMVFPVILILIGCWFIFSRISGKKRHLNTDRISHFAFFSSIQTNIESQNFTGGSVAAVFGGAEINLRDAEISEKGADLELTAVFGGIGIIVPKHWNVQITGTPLFGGWENKAVYVPSDDIGRDPILKINCTSVFGGVSIKN
ncbi:MAG: LiaF transmembrane domain-containing protein [Caldicoprobacterales bacterium]|jgi:predicted membrane protein|nr:cell wall-active antibiotics response protein [Clostridiales bacterium]